MNVFRFVFQSRGPLNLTRRTFQVLTRFGIGSGKMDRRFDRFMGLLEKYGCRPTFPITALPMARHPDFARKLLGRGAELAVHACTHIDLTTLDAKGQSANIGRAVRLFRENGIPFSGFRAPYLRWNEDTMRAVETYQFRYSSNQAVWWDVVDPEGLKPYQKDGIERGRAFYNPLDASRGVVLPFWRRGFVEIPISMPDDEILFDRMYVHEKEALWRVWESMLERTHKRGELLTVQLHPERIDFFAEPLSYLLSLSRGRRPGVWVATLGEIADWWIARSRNSAKFMPDGGVIRVEVKVCEGTDVFLRMDAKERKTAPGEIIIEGEKRPCVGISPGSSREAVQVLRDKGYIIEVGGEDEGFSIHLGKVEDPSHGETLRTLEKLEDFPGPLVRFGTWPHGNRSALAVTGDIDAVTIWDFLSRVRGA